MDKKLKISTGFKNYFPIHTSVVYVIEFIGFNWLCPYIHIIDFENLVKVDTLNHRNNLF